MTKKLLLLVVLPLMRGKCSSKSLFFTYDVKRGEDNCQLEEGSLV